MSDSPSVSYPLGSLVATPALIDEVVHDDILKALARHARGDWGDVCAEDQQANNLALRDGTRLLSSYTSSTGVKFWVITEADRSLTTVLLPSDY
jgi:hypothetical protein